MTDTLAKKTWTKVTLAECCDEVARRIENPAQSGFDRFVGLEHLGTGEISIGRWGSTKDVTSSMKLFKAGDVIVARRNVYLRRASRADFDGVCSGDGIVLRGNPEVCLPELLPFLLNTDSFWSYVTSQADGTMSKRITVKRLLSYEFALPLLGEQWRIAGVLQAATDVSETLSSSMRSAETLLRSAVDSAAKRAVDRQSVDPLAAIIDAERPICYGILMPGTGFKGGVPVVKVKDYPEGEIIVDGLLLTDPKIDNEYKRSRLRPGDLLISIRGTIGRLAFVPKSLDGANITQDTARLSIRSEHDYRYVRAMLESTFVQRQIAAFTTGLAVKGINIGELRRIQIPMVSPEEQQEVVKEVIAVRAAIQGIEERLDLSKTLRKALLAEYLGGTA